MRLSLLGSACTGAVLSTILILPLMAQSAPQALPLLAQPAPKTFNITIAGTGANAIRLHCKDVSHLSACIDGLKSLSRRDSEQLKILVPKLQQKLENSLSATQDHSSECLAMRVYQFPRGYPDKNAKAQPKVSDCTSVARVKILTIGTKKAYLSGQ